MEVHDESVRGELETLPAEVLARFRRIAELIQSHGLEHIDEPHVKRLACGTWEMRMRGRDGIERVVLFTASGFDVVVVKVFVEE